jgi:hypothetical protein
MPFSAIFPGRELVMHSYGCDFRIYVSVANDSNHFGLRLSWRLFKLHMAGHFNRCNRNLGRLKLLEMVSQKSFDTELDVNV